MYGCSELKSYSFGIKNKWTWDQTSWVWEVIWFVVTEQGEVDWWAWVNNNNVNKIEVRVEC